jgi:hypothetical protein
MKFIQSYKKWAVMLLLVGASTACDDMLNEPLDRYQVVEDGLESVTMDGLAIGAYAQFYDFGWEVYPLIAVRGDDVNAAGDQAPLIDTDRFAYGTSTWMPNSVWQGLYSEIVLFNATIETIAKLNESASNPAIGAQYIAEIKVLRAFELLQVARLWGNVLIPTGSNLTDLYNTPVSTHAEVMQHISDQMDEAIPSLPAVRPNERTDIRGGVTKYTALAVKAWANLEMENYQGVADATGEIIQSGRFTLDADYYNLFKIPGKLGNENLLELQYSDFGQGTGDLTGYLWDFFGPNAWTPEVPGAYAGWGFWEPTFKYIKFMIDRDEEVRLTTNVLFTPYGLDSLIEADPSYDPLPNYISNVTPDGDWIGVSDGGAEARALFSSGKFYLPSTQLTPGRTGYGTNNNFRCIRYAHVLLMHAEALVSGASSSVMSADAAVNLVRDRAGLAPITGVDIDDVLDEKFAELATEWGTRFEDLIRHGRTEELASQDSKGNAWSYTPSDRFLPYPQQQVDVLPQLADAQNNN